MNRSFQGLQRLLLRNVKIEVILLLSPERNIEHKINFKEQQIMKKSITNVLSLSVLTLLFSFSIPNQLKAQVVINGQLIQGQELATLEYYLGHIPAGRYWLDTNTGYWGYEGNPQIQGNIFLDGNTSGSNYGSVDSNYSQGGAGGYGSYASDGQCSYMSIEGMSVKTCN